MSGDGVEGAAQVRADGAQHDYAGHRSLFGLRSSKPTERRRVSAGGARPPDWPSSEGTFGGAPASELSSRRPTIGQPGQSLKVHRTGSEAVEGGGLAYGAF